MRLFCLKIAVPTKFNSLYKTSTIKDLVSASNILLLLRSRNNSLKKDAHRFGPGVHKKFQLYWPSRSREKSDNFKILLKN